MIYHLVYTSKSSLEATPSSIDDIATVSQRNNDELGITGVLVAYKSGFLQMLEGERNLVEEIYARIKEDGRHFDIELLHCGYVPHRLFDRWTMAFDSYEMFDTEVRHVVARSKEANIPGYAPPEFRRLLETLHPSIDTRLDTSQPTANDNIQ